MKKKGNRAVLAAVILALSVMFCSCDGVFSTNVDALITPPMILEEQNDIMRALKHSVGDKIELEYPRTGDNRAAFILFDADSDGKNEVIAFYRTAGEDTAQEVVHINVLDCTEKEGWVSVCDSVGEATAIDRVSIGSFSGKCTIVVGWELLRDRERLLMCYTYSAGGLARSYSSTYTEFSVDDFWPQNDGDELITLNYTQAVDNLVQPVQHARLITVKGEDFSVISTVPLDFRVTGYKSCVSGYCDKTRRAYFLDGIISINAVNTQILVVNADGHLLNPLLSGTTTDESNIHKPTLLTQDIDGDGILEVPHQKEITGYEELPESERIYKTVFKRLSGNQLKDIFDMYISTNLGIRITIPREVEGKMTMKPIASQNELAFYRYGGSLEKSTEEIFSLRVSKKELYEQQEGYEELVNNDFIVVTVKKTEPESRLCPETEELEKAVKII